MTRIDLSPVKPRIPQCEVCGRVRIKGVWTRDDSVQPGETILCGLCMDQQRRTRERAARAHVRKLRRLEFETESAKDPFSVIRYDAGDEFWKPEKGE